MHTPMPLAVPPFLKLMTQPAMVSGPAKKENGVYFRREAAQEKMPQRFMTERARRPSRSEMERTTLLLALAVAESTTAGASRRSAKASIRASPRTKDWLFLTCGEDESREAWRSSTSRMPRGAMHKATAGNNRAARMRMMLGNENEI